MWLKSVFFASKLQKSLSGWGSVHSHYMFSRGEQSATSAIAEVALLFSFLFWNIAEVALRTKVFKSYCALIALRFQNFFWLIAQFYTFNLILFHFERNIDKCQPSLAHYLLFFCLKSQKMRHLHCAVKFQLLKLNCALAYLSNNSTLSFQWVSGHAGLPGNEKADSLAKAGVSLPTDAIPCPLPPVVAKVRYSQYRNWRRHISHSHVNFQVPEVFSEELLLSRPIRCELSPLRCHGHSFLLSSYLHRISRKENSACSACGHPLQDLNHLLDCPASEPLRKSIFGYSLSILDLWTRPWGVARLLGLRRVPPRPHPSEGVG